MYVVSKMADGKCTAFKYFPSLYWHTNFRYRYVWNWAAIWLLVPNSMNGRENQWSGCAVFYFDVKSGFCSTDLSHFIQSVTGHKTQDRSEFSAALESTGSIQKSTRREFSGFGTWSDCWGCELQGGSGVCSSGKTGWNYNHRNAVFSVPKTTEAVF